MKDEDVQNLLGGFATDTLSDRERELLYTAALRDQKLFDALADEQALRELLTDPGARLQLLLSLQPAPAKPGAWESLTGWMRRPVSWAIAGAAVAALLVAVALRREMAVKTPVEMAKSEAPAALATNEPLPAPRPIVAPLAKMKVAVLDFKSPPAVEKKAEKEADVGKTASDLLGKKLDSSGYAVIDRKQVDQALQDRNLSGSQLDASTAASVGRSLGADAVIVGSVQPAPPPAPPAPAENARATPGAFRERESAQQAQQSRDLQVTATAINPKTASKLAVASAKSPQAPGGALSKAVDQVALSLRRQIQQKAPDRISGAVTAVTGAFLTLGVGANAGIKLGDRLEVLRDAKPIGHVAITAVKDSFAVGEFQGDGPARIGDTVASEQTPPSKPPPSN